MSLRDELQPCVDDARGIVDELGLRQFTVVVRTRVWDGGRPGAGTASDTDLTLDPVPRVRDPSPRLVFASPGVYEDGDRVVDKISRAYTPAQLGAGSMATNTEVFWLLNGDAYRLVKEPLKRNFGYRVHLRRMTR